jgi:superfamily II DNA helicase RecQ
MQIQIFTIPAFANQEQLEEMNSFLRVHTIIDMEKSCITTNTNTFWTFCIRYTEGNHTEKLMAKPKVDYKEVLDGPTFKIFSDLRDCRKKLAENMGLPIYAIFTNEELASISKLPGITVENVKKIDGIGEKKTEKYGIELLKLYANLIVTP